MPMTLDPRQRAMLQDMGITIWLPKSVAPTPSEAVHSDAVAVVAEQASAPVPTISTPAAPVPAAVVLAQPKVPAPATEPAPVSTQAAGEVAASIEWQISPAVQAFPQATGGSAGDAWLVIWECPNPTVPLQGESGKLLHNMLRALRLHHSPYVWLASVQRPGYDALPAAGVAADAVAWQALAPGLVTHVQQTQAARILVLGLHTARAVLGSQEALGRLRAQVHQVHNTPTVVSYDPAYLLRSPHAKPAAWADLCRAHALRPPSGQ